MLTKPARRFMCPECKQSFNSGNLLKRHYESAHTITADRSLSRTLSMSSFDGHFPIDQQAQLEQGGVKDRCCEIWENQECRNRDLLKESSRERVWRSPKAWPGWTDSAGVGVACPTDLTPPSTPQVLFVCSPSSLVSSTLASCFRCQ